MYTLCVFDYLYLYKVMVPGLSMTYIPAKLTCSVEEAKTIAAEYSLVQLGYPMEGITNVEGEVRRK